MASRGFLIRFIDIGLIVLFGFLMISDIEAYSRVELADTASEVEERLDEEDERAFLIVRIGAEGSFSVTDERSNLTASTPAGDLEDLAEALRTMSGFHEEEGLETVVLIEPDPASIVQFTVDVMDVCDRLSLAKSLRMNIEIEAPPGRDRSGSP